MDTKGHNKELQSPKGQDSRVHSDNFVLEKGIFSNIFEKDIRRVYIYKKAERLAKAIHLVSPAFRTAPALRDRMDSIAVGLVDAAILPPTAARDGMSRELLALSSVLSIARTGGLLSSMNAELISHEAQQLLQEVATYEEPRLFLDDTPSLAELAKEAGAERLLGSVRTPFRNEGEHAKPEVRATRAPAQKRSAQPADSKGQNTGDSKGQAKGAVKDKALERRGAIRSILSSKGPSYIKDISTLIRNVSEKTIQRELQAMIESGEVTKKGERRWTIYALAG